MKPAKGRMKPRKRFFGKSVFHRIEMNIVQMTIHIQLVPDYVIPESSLPQASFLQPRSFSIQSTEGHLKSLHYGRGIVLLTIQDHMDVIRQSNPSAAGSCTQQAVACLPEEINVFDEYWSPLVGYNGHETRLPGTKIPQQLCHDKQYVLDCR
jgi:hypothetical protein